jgi:hypothetical protein
MRRGTKSILASTLAMGLALAWSIAESPLAFAQPGAGGHRRGGYSTGGYGRGAYLPGGYGRGAYRYGFSGDRHGGYGRSGFGGHGYGGFPGGHGPHHGRSSFGPLGYGHGSWGPAWNMHFGVPVHPYFYELYHGLYTPPYPPTPYDAGYAPPYRRQHQAVNPSYTAPTTSTTGPVIPASGKAAGFQLQAEQAFRERRYEDAARLSSHAIVEDGQNGKLHLFAALTLFSLGEFQSAAATIQHAAGALDRGEWGFVVKNYQQLYRGDDYMTQMARLVEFIEQKPDVSYARFLLGYHYLFLGYTESAREQLAKAVELESRDRLAAELLTMAGGEELPVPRAMERGRKSN